MSDDYLFVANRLENWTGECDLEPIDLECYRCGAKIRGQKQAYEELRSKAAEEGAGFDACCRRCGAALCKSEGDRAAISISPSTREALISIGYDPERSVRDLAKEIVDSPLEAWED